MARDVKIKGIAAVTLDPLLLNSVAKSLSTSDKIDWHTLLARPDKDSDVDVFPKMGQIYFLNVFEIYEK